MQDYPSPVDFDCQAIAHLFGAHDLTFNPENVASCKTENSSYLCEVPHAPAALESGTKYVSFTNGQNRDC